ncbi:hypothetical protein [Corynebacterium pacaense]|uniref:hypothetical protein n=1 Tax=Corynebacterium pacaense TaxID=1816684 RepID=UPI0009BAE97E|nr:hypothetical protein [Corynebacterium pacaense]
MDGTGVRQADPGSAGLEDLAQLGRAERIEVLRSRMSSMGAAALKLDAPAGGVSDSQVAPGDVVAAPGAVADLFPGGGLMRRQVTVMGEQPLLVLDFLTRVTASGGCAAVVGWRDLGLAGLVGAGGVCDNLIVIPDPGPEPLNVAAVLCEGLDLVVYRGPEIMLSPSRARPLLGKLRKGAAALLMVGTQVASPAARVESSITGYGGIGRGTGRIRSVEMRVRVLARGRAAASRTVVVHRTEDEALLGGHGATPALRVV